MKKIIIYDFDGTLTPYSMPKFEILKKCGIENYSKKLGFKLVIKARMVLKKIDIYTAIYEILFETIKKCGFDLNDKNLSLGANKIEYNPGVEEFIQYLNVNNVDNYIVSSGMEYYLKNTKIAPLFKEIYATKLNYDKENNVSGIKDLMDDRNKVNAIKDIMIKNGLEDCSDIIYVGDGLTDVYSFEFVHNNGGKAIFVYQNENDKKIPKIKEKGIVDYFAKADYTLNSELSKYVINECKI